MSTYFSDIVMMDRQPELGPPCDFKFRMRDVVLGSTIINSIKRAAMRDILTYTISPDSVNIKEDQSPWDKEMLTHQLVFMPLRPSVLSKIDLNMLRVNLNVSNEGTGYRWVFADEIEVLNAETKQKLKLENVIVYPQMPLFTLGPKQTVSLTCMIEKMTKNEAEKRRTKMGAIHQTSSIGVSFDETSPDVDPKEIFVEGHMQTGLTPKQLISMGMGRLIGRLINIQNTLKKALESQDILRSNMIKPNANSRYDFTFINEDHTVGNLITKWFNRHDPQSATGYRQPDHQRVRTIVVDYGLFKFAPNISHERLEAGQVEDVLRTTDKTVQDAQLRETVQTFIEMVSRIEAYIRELHLDWKKVSTTNISTSDYVDQALERRKALAN